VQTKDFSTQSVSAMSTIAVAVAACTTARPEPDYAATAFSPKYPAPSAGRTHHDCRHV
jgi:hypothetical protein